MRNDHPFVVASLAFLVLTAAILLFRLWPNSPFGWQPWICVSETCTLQGWLSALSGWIAAAVAAATITPLWQQLREARRQTSFIVGDDPPTLEITQRGWGQGGKFRIVNWNRRPFYVCEIRWSAGVPIIELEDLHVGDVHFTSIDPGGHLKRRLVIDGWEDRSRPPPSSSGEFGYIVDDQADIYLRQSGTAKLEVIGYLSGELRQDVILRADAPITETEFYT